MSADVVVGIVSSVAVAVISIAVALARVSARVARLEEWVRQREREENHHVGT